MDNAVLRSRLHDYIDQADDDLLLAIYVLLGKSVSRNHSYDESTLKMLYKRVEDDVHGMSTSYSKEDTLSYVRSQKPDQG